MGVQLGFMGFNSAVTSSGLVRGAVARRASTPGRQRETVAIPADDGAPRCGCCSPLLARSSIPADRKSPFLQDPLARAQARRPEGLTLYATGELPEATSILLDAARMIEPYDTSLARDTPLDAFAAAQFSGQSGAASAEVLQAVWSAPRAAATLADLLLNGFAAVGEHRYQAGFEFLRQAIAPLTGGQPLPGDAQRFMTISMAASLLYDSAWHELSGL
jgi:hypothetical protein